MAVLHAIAAAAAAWAVLAAPPSVAPLLVDAIDRSFEHVTDDGITVHGVVSYPTEAHKAGRDVPLAVLVHGFGLDRDSVAALSDALVEAGFATARFDLRGHGRSRVRNGSGIYVFPVVPYEEFPRSVDDLLAIAAKLRQREGIDGSRVAFVGVAEGALIAAEAAARDPEVRATVLVDPSASALGFWPERALGVVGTRPVLLVSSSQPPSVVRAEGLAEYGLGERAIEQLESFEARHRLVGPVSPGLGVVVRWLAARIDAGAP